MSGGRPGRRGLLGALVGLLLAGGALFGSPPAPAGAGPAVAATPALTLIEQTAWVRPDDVFSMVIDTGSSRIDPDGRIRIRLRAAVANRDEFTVGLGDAGPGPVDTEITVATALAQRAGGRLVLTLPTGPEGPLPVDTPGVYPLDVAVDLRDGETADLLTHLVRLPAADDRADLRLAMVVPVGARPLTLPGGGVRTTRPVVERIEQRVNPLAERPDVALTVVPVPETMQSLATTPRGRAVVDELDAALGARQVLAAPYVEIDEARWVDNGLAAVLADQSAAGLGAIATTMRVDADPGTRLLSEAPSAATLRTLAAEHVDHVVVPATTIEPAGRPPAGSPWPAPVVLTTPSARTVAAVTDADLQAHARRTGDPVLDAHRTLADLAVIAQSRPSTPVGVVLTLPLQAEPGGRYLRTLLRHVGGGPIRAVTLADWFAEAGTPETIRGVAARETRPLDAYRQAIGLTDLALNSYRELTEAADPVLADLRRQALVSGSMRLTPDRQSAYLSSVGAQVRGQVQLIDLPDDQTVTLTSRSGRIPVSLRNRMGEPARVRIRVRSERLEFPEGSVVDVALDEEITTVEIPVRTRTSGSFQMQVEVTSPDGVLAVDATQVTIRSTAVSGVGLVLSVGAGLVLLTWWARHWREHRRDPRLIAEPSPPTGTA